MRPLSERTNPYARLSQTGAFLPLRNNIGVCTSQAKDGDSAMKARWIESASRFSLLL
jgi:hypothetical protein